MTQNKALTIIDPNQYLAVRKEDIRAILSETLAPGEQFGVSDLPRIRIPAGGAQVWETPSGEPAKELQGIVLYRQLVRAYWAAEFSGEGNPPDCSSLDNVHGRGLYDGQHFMPDGEVANAGGLCVTCLMSQWDSGRSGSGQACRLITRLFVLFPDSLLPTMVALPPSSYTAGKAYVSGLAALGFSLQRVVTAIGLTKGTSKGGISYSQATFRKVAELPPEAIGRIQAYAEKLIPALTAAPVVEAEDA